MSIADSHVYLAWLYAAFLDEEGQSDGMDSPDHLVDCLEPAAVLEGLLLLAMLPTSPIE